MVPGQAYHQLYLTEGGRGALQGASHFVEEAWCCGRSDGIRRRGSGCYRGGKSEDMQALIWHLGEWGEVPSRGYCVWPQRVDDWNWNGGACRLRYWLHQCYEENQGDLPIREDQWRYFKLIVWLPRCDEDSWVDSLCILAACHLGVRYGCWYCQSPRNDCLRRSWARHEAAVRELGVQ